MNPLRLVAPLLILAAPAAARAAGPFALADGDRVVLLGNTLVEREQRYGYWEAALTARFPKENVTFRNLGWSGDTVFGEARAGFGTAADGFKHLRDHALALKPTVLVVGYGANESFEGRAGLPRFVAGLNTLLDTLAPAKARVILLSPLRHEDLGRPLPDPAAANKDLRLYADAIKDVAARRGCRFVDLYDLLGRGAEPAEPLTDNGIQLTAYGYWRSAAALLRGLGLPAARWRLDLNADGTEASAPAGAKVTPAEGGGLRFTVTDDQLPLPAPAAAPAAKGEAARVLRVRGLDAGSYTLAVDGKPVAAASAKEWQAGVPLTRGPEFDQAERLRAAVVAKDRLYFHRWRPENETYLFGFRKQEQGQNAREIPQFDPLVAEREAEIARLRVPAPHTYYLRRDARP